MGWRLELDRMRATIHAGEWSVTYSPAFLNQVAKGTAKPSAVRSASALPGNHDPMLGYFMKLGELCG